jgi:uncharacterized protein
MKVTYDPCKNGRNVALRGLSFERAVDLDWETARVREDDRQDYVETRLIALAFLDGRLHVLCFLPTPLGIRVISFRKANAREERVYEKQKAAD